MTPQEQQMLQGLTDRVSQTQVSDKDPEAEQFLAQRLGNNRDALYILAQTVLVQQYALDNAKKQMTELKSQLDQARQSSQGQAAAPPQKHGSFLGNLLGMHEDAAPQQQAQNQQYAPVNTGSGSSVPYGTQGAPVQQQAPQQGGFGGMFGGSGGSSFLRTAATTAAGVAAGEMAFRGIEDLMHGFGGSSDQGPREVVENNYFGGDGGQDRNDLGDYQSRDVEDRRGDSFGERLASSDGYDNGGGQGFLDTSASNQDDNLNGDNDDAGTDFSDDSGGYDDSNN